MSSNKQQHRLKECVGNVISRAYLPLHVCLLIRPSKSSSGMLLNALIPSAKPLAVITHFCSGELLIKLIQRHVLHNEHKYIETFKITRMEIE